MLPHEWRAARDSFRDLRSEVLKHKEAAAQFALGFIAPFGLGAAISWTLLPATIARVAQGSGAAELLAVAAGVLAFAAILIGFVVTLMLSTGKVELPSHIQYEEVEKFLERTKYLLYSQAVTLFAAIVLCGVIVVWSLMVAAGLDSRILVPVGAIAGGFTGICLIRSMLLPLQIWELHRAGFDYLLASWRRASDEKHRKK